jgi:hypothetical protein
LDDRYHRIGRITYELLDRLTLSGRFDVTLFVGRGQRSGRFDIDRIGVRPGVRLVHVDHALTSAGQYLRWPAALRRASIDVALFPYHLGASMFGGGRRFAIVHDCILEADRRFAPDARTADRAGAVSTGPMDVHPDERSIKVGRSIRKSPPSARRW